VALNKVSCIYALDFDGVICDSALETAITGWKAASRIWQDMPEPVPQELVARFRLVRPIIETGYEAILAMRLLYLGETVEAIYSGYGDKTQALLKGAGITVDDLKTLFGETRDAWIADDLVSWVQMNPLFDGVAEKLRVLNKHEGIPKSSITPFPLREEVGRNDFKSISYPYSSSPGSFSKGEDISHDALCPWYVVTTKQERFVKQILSANAIELSGERIFGLDRNMGKLDVLKALMKKHPNEKIVFVEDRLQALLNVMKDDGLTQVNLIFALWGYSTDEDKALAAQQPFTLLQLGDFLS
jgi:hypothetical protein